MTEKSLSPAEQGMLMALTSIVAALRNTPGFDAQSMETAAKFFTENPPPGCESGNAFSAYEWPLQILQQDVSQLQIWMNQGQTRN